MQNLFYQHLQTQFPFLENKKLLLAVSGGLDSMVLLHLLEQLPCTIAIAHCNFQLRGIESFEDQSFVQEYALQHQIPFFCTQFDTQAFANDYKLSTQVAARELRYDWFYEQLELHQFDFVLTAHHADDNLETFLINLSRGTGLDGLSGIPAQNEAVIRPLLPFSRTAIEEYAKVNNLQWREDSSNASDKYLRNQIRHHLVPMLKELNPDFLKAFGMTQEYLQQAQELVSDAASMVYQQVAREDGDTIYFDLKQLMRLPNYASYLYQWLKEYGFSAWDDIYNLVDSQSGKQVFSADYRLLKDRDFFILSPIQEPEKEIFFIEKNQDKVKIPLKLQFCKVTDIYKADSSAIFVDESKLAYPLVLRKWQEGDFFYPLGMNGKSKKVSKFFKDEKISLLDKENTWLLCSNEAIVWVIGMRADERFKVEHTTNTIIKIELI
ncbi:tRNA lysidine(34) synthetase TilS [Flavobacterium polysaccharolyticum]|uniref:tRNA(Ile)-lysidine synthase n=1 Tax=Flavobacterium polysaccharolyticum TaxID=3133148 RepID=A0ABU9NLQ4_9FLAO